MTCIVFDGLCASLTVEVLLLFVDLASVKSS